MISSPFPLGCSAKVCACAALGSLALPCRLSARAGTGVRSAEGPSGRPLLTCSARCAAPRRASAIACRSHDGRAGGGRAWRAWRGAPGALRGGRRDGGSAGGAGRGGRAPGGQLGAAAAQLLRERRPGPQAGRCGAPRSTTCGTSLSQAGQPKPENMRVERDRALSTPPPLLARSAVCRHSKQPHLQRRPERQAAAPARAWPRAPACPGRPRRRCPRHRRRLPPPRRACGARPPWAPGPLPARAARRPPRRREGLGRGRAALRTWLRGRAGARAAAARTGRPP